MKPTGVFWFMAGLALVILAGGLVYIGYSGRIINVDIKNLRLQVNRELEAAAETLADVTNQLQQVELLRSNLITQADVLADQAAEVVAAPSAERAREIAAESERVATQLRTVEFTPVRADIERASRSIEAIRDAGFRSP